MNDKPRPCGSRGSYWLDAETSRLRKLHQMGAVDRDIAKALQRTKASVRHKRLSLGLAPNQFPNKLGPGCYKPWTRDESAHALSLRNEGMTAREIAQILGRTVQAVENHIGRAKIKARQPVNYELTQSREKQERACQGELRALIKHHKWFAAEIMAGRGVNGLPRWEKSND